MPACCYYCYCFCISLQYQRGFNSLRCSWLFAHVHFYRTNICACGAPDIAGLRQPIGLVMRRTPAPLEKGRYIDYIVTIIARRSRALPFAGIMNRVVVLSNRHGILMINPLLYGFVQWLVRQSMRGCEKLAIFITFYDVPFFHSCTWLHP